MLESVITKVTSHVTTPFAVQKSLSTEQWEQLLLAPYACNPKLCISDLPNVTQVIRSWTLAQVQIHQLWSARMLLQHPSPSLRTITLTTTLLFVLKELGFWFLYLHVLVGYITKCLLRLLQEIMCPRKWGTECPFLTMSPNLRILTTTGSEPGDRERHEMDACRL